MVPLIYLAMLAQLQKPPAVEHAVVVLPVANMYSRASTDADVVSQAIFSTNVVIADENGPWLRILTPDNYSGWISSTAVVRARSYALGDRVVQVEALFANLYREPDLTKHQPVITIPFESRLEVIGDAVDGGRWLPVRLPGDRSAWVQSGDVTASPPKMSIPEMIEWSKRFTGIPYLWGGTSTFGYDCSGFVQMLYRRIGYGLPRDAQPQADWEQLKAVERNELQPGDLLYFGASAKQIAHTGMYLGNGQFIDATAYQHPMVQIDNLNDEHWTSLFVAARRIN